MGKFDPHINWCKERRDAMRRELKIAQSGRMKRGGPDWRDTTKEWIADTKRQIAEMEKRIKNLQKRND